jgi:hypothetical protein
VKQSLASFVAQWNGRACDFDRAYGYQCVDLVQYWARDGLGRPPLVGNAVDAWWGAQAGGWVRVANGPQNSPTPGDVVVWGPSAMAGTGATGHIAVAVLADAMHLISFDQNYPSGSWCHVQVHSYDGVLGWLRSSGG